MHARPTAILTAVFVALFVPGMPASAQDSRSADPAEVRAARVESGLLPQARVVGRTYQGQTLADLMRDKNLPALSVAVIDDGQIAWVRAYGLADVATGRQATPQTRFQAASISKAVSAIAALDMVEDGLFDLDQPVNSYLTGWTIPDSAASSGRPVTLRQLLGHTAGLTVHGFPGYAPGAPLPSTIQILNGEAPANTGAVVVNTEPGLTWRYSGGGFTVLQLLMQETAGRPFEDLLHSRVLEPFGMTQSTFEQAAEAAAPRATAYTADGNPVAGGGHLYPEMAAAGLWTTPTDLARWAIGLMDAWTGKAETVITQETARTALTPGLGGWGLGLAVKGDGEEFEFEHGGSNEGFRALVLAFPERGQGIVIMTNSDVGMSVGVSVLQAVAAEYGWPGYEPVTITPVALTPGQLAQVAGMYAGGGVQIEIRPSASGDSLDVTVSNGMRLELVPVGDDTYADIDAGGKSMFERDAQGMVVAFNPGFARFDRVGPIP